ncbi:MAG: hypothetical protein J6M10_05775, partial [Clostridia bacterium]|nr:hypothetical protein [Clostridia bacterium]
MKKRYRVIDGVTRKVKKRYRVVANFVPRDLPEGFTQVEYIEGTGTQYINSLIQPNQDTSVYMDAQITQVPGSVKYAYFGARRLGDKIYFALMKAGTNTTPLYWEYSDFASNTWSIDYTARRQVITDGPSATVDGVTKTYEAATFEVGLDLYLLACNDDGSVIAITPGRIYPSQILQARALARDYVPCVKADGEAGLYDMVSGAFFGNAGTGAFIAGPTLRMVTRLCYTSEVFGGYTGTYTTSEVTGTDGKPYTLYTLTSSGTLTLGDDVQYWMCGGGGKGG